MRRGSALLNTLLLSVLVALVVLAMASSTTSHLQLQLRHLQRSEEDAAARAALVGFLARCQQLAPPPDVTATATPLLDAFRADPWILKPSPHLQAQARLQLERCTDNSANASPVRSFFDPAAQANLPPFSYSLAIELWLGGRRRVYEALVQQRWPYALAAPGPIALAGGLERPGWKLVPSQIEGEVLALQSQCVVANPVGMQSWERPMVPISFELFQNLINFAGREDWNDPRVQLGGSINFHRFARHDIPASEHSSAGFYWLLTEEAVSTEGALLDGDAHFCENRVPTYEGLVTRPVLRVGPNSEHRGSVLHNARPGGIDPQSKGGQTALASLFAWPDTSQWTQITPPFGKPLVLTSTPRVARADEVVVTVPPRVRLGSLFGRGLGNHYSISRLTLQDVALAVDGDLNLEKCHLEGFNSTLLVKGSLVLDGGQLDAGQAGLVIHCSSLLCRATGHFRGLIVADRGAAFHGGEPVAGNSSPVQPSGQHLIIEGGLLVGDNRLQVIAQGEEELKGPTGETYSRQLNLPRLTLIATQLKFAPRFVRTLNRFGDYEVKGFEQRFGF